MTTSPITVLFVCTANICRSRFAEGLASSLQPEELVRVSSAGTHARSGDLMDPLMVGLLESRGIRSDHARGSRPLSAESLTGADLIVTMEVDHRTHILDDHPHLVGRTYTLGQLRRAMDRLPVGVQGPEVLTRVKRFRGTARPEDDVTDPYGRGPAPTAEAADLIEDHVRAVFSRLVPDTAQEGS